MEPLELEIPCPECDGSGLMQNPTWRVWYERQGMQLPPPDHWLHRQPEDVECLECRGLGYIPTPLGRCLLEFIRRHNG
jgi:hypothetical protein